MSENQNIMSMGALLKSGEIPWKSSKTVLKMIKEEKFPAMMIQGNWYFNVEQIRLWFKRREFKAS